MRITNQRCSGGRERETGFTLVACLWLMILLAVLAVGLMGLASIELRKSSRELTTQAARTNARLALMQAIGQLQKNLGPDQRVSATAEILNSGAKQPHWTGAWRSTQANGDPIFTRDDLNGGLRDSRWEKKTAPAAQVIEWLVSGTGDPHAASADDTVSLLKQDNVSVVDVQKVSVSKSAAGISGHFAWWTGDLGVRANLATADPRSDVPSDRKSPPNEGLYRVMASQAADISMMEGKPGIEDAELPKLASHSTMELTSAGREWSRKHALDFTTTSYGVLADVVEGGLKRDLTSYFQSAGRIPDFKGLKGISDSDSIISTGVAASRHQVGGPRFGLLRDWARSSVPYAGKKVAGRLPDLDPAAGKESPTRALANENPVKLGGNQRAGRQPILVEATNFTQMSTYLNKDGPVQWYQIRQLMYPRVVLWNPYNCELSFGHSIVMIQGNGRQEMKTRNRTSSGYEFVADWLNFEGGRNINFGGGGLAGIMNSEAYNDPYMGSYYFSIPATTFKPGECLVFSPAKAAEYDGYSAYRPTDYNLNANILSCEVPPDPGRCYYVSASDYDDPDDPNEDFGISFVPYEFWYSPTYFYVNGKYDSISNQGDDSRAVLKQVDAGTNVTFESFDKLPQVCVLSGSVQYGAGREPRISWNANDPMPMELLDKKNPKPTVIPNVRTREGVRLRWFDEHPSNADSGSLAGTPYLQDALLGNWNPRASFIIRSPWENIGGTAPWFFGAYTRDLYDQAVSWDDQVPVPRDGRYHGNPFGPPQEGEGRYVLFDVPRNETGILSLGQLQHSKLSELVWQPSYAIGNSLADPRLGTGGYKGLARTSPVLANTASAKLGGFYQNEIGWAADNSQRSVGKSDWADTGRAILGDLPADDNVVYDLSFEVNRALWDRYFLSSGTVDEKSKFLADPWKHPLPNGRMCLAQFTRQSASDSTLTDFHRSAYQLMVDGAFNVNSTRVEAWKALLGSTRRSGFNGGVNVPFPRVLNPPGDAWKNGDPAFGDDVWDGYRELTPDEIDRLARAIVEQVKSRGPFLSLADFVNRRLAEDETGRTGALQAAIESAGLNATLTAEYPLANKSSLPDYNHPDNIADATRMEQTLKPASKAWGAPSYLTQADVLQVLGPVLTARSDTFVIRAYGDAVDAAGNIQSRAWCEAVVQRTPQPLDPDDSGLNPKLAGSPGDFGRRFVVTSFRWLAPGEI